MKNLVAAIAAVLALGLLSAPDGYGQSLGSDRETLLPPGPNITLDVENADVTSILALVAEAKKLNIIAGPEVAGKVSISLRDVPFEEAMNAILGVAGFTHYKVGNIIYVTTEAKKREMPSATSDIVTESFHVNHVDAKELLPSVTEFISPAGKAILSAPKTIVVRDSPENVNAVADLIAKLDVPLRQVLIVAHILSVDRKNNLDLGAGVDTQPFQLYGGDIVSSGLAKIVPGVAAISQTKPKTTYTGTTTAKDLSTSSTTSSSATGSTGTTGASGTSTGTAIPQGLFISTVQKDFRAFLSALEDRTDVTVLAAPEILAVDGQKARIQVGERLGYRVTTTTTTASLESIDFIEVGTVLEVTPTIASDGLVRLTVHPKISSGALSPTGVPTENTTEVTTEMLVKDGETIIIGGLLDASKQRSKSQIPVLGDIPLLGKLFSHNTNIDNKREIMIMMTPVVIGARPTPEMQARIDAAQTTVAVDLSKSPLTRNPEAVQPARNKDKALSELDPPKEQVKKRTSNFGGRKKGGGNQ